MQLQPGDVAMASGLLVILSFPANHSADIIAIVIVALGFAAQCWAFWSRRAPGQTTR
jgi:hypothetical protein